MRQIANINYQFLAFKYYYAIENFSVGFTVSNLKQKKTLRYADGILIFFTVLVYLFSKLSLC